MPSDGRVAGDSSQERRPHLLVLDLDETLIHASETPLHRAADHMVYGYHVYLRPHLDAFLRSCFDHYAASFSRVRREDDDYTFFDPWNHRHYLKPLAKLKRFGWTLDQMLIVDDTPEKCIRNYGNAIYPSEYDGRDDDNELLLLGHYLETLKDASNLRRLEKRRWRALVQKD